MINRGQDNLLINLNILLIRVNQYNRYLTVGIAENP